MGIGKTGDSAPADPWLPNSKPETKDNPPDPATGFNREITKVGAKRPRVQPRHEPERYSAVDSPPPKRRRGLPELRIDVEAANKAGALKPQNFSNQASELYNRLPTVQPGPSCIAEPKFLNEFSLHPIRNHDTELWAHSMPRDKKTASMWLLANEVGAKTIVALERWLADYKQYKGETDTYSVAASVKHTEPLSGIQAMSPSVLSPKQASKAQKHVVNVTYTNKNTGEVSNKEFTVIEHLYWEDGKGVHKALIPEILKVTPDRDCMIHCMAGLGRTGTLIILKQMEKAHNEGKTLSRDNLVEFIAQAVVEGRVMRSHGDFVQKPEQVQSLLDHGMTLTGAGLSDIDKQLSKLPQ